VSVKVWARLACSVSFVCFIFNGSFLLYSAILLLVFLDVVLLLSFLSTRTCVYSLCIASLKDFHRYLNSRKKAVPLLPLLNTSIFFMKHISTFKDMKSGFMLEHYSDYFRAHVHIGMKSGFMLHGCAYVF
jgi:hypothetical protein